MPARSLTPSDLDRAHAAYSARAWNDAYAAFALADARAPLAPADLERMGWSAALTRRSEESFRALERLYQARLDAGDELPAARAAFFVGILARTAGEHGRANGWLSRAHRLVEDKDCAEAGYLLLAEIWHLDSTGGEIEQMATLARRAAEIGDRFADRELSAFGRALGGRAALRLGRVDAGLALLDEAMLSVTTEALLPLLAGFIYCIVIASCHQVYALGRAREWTEALAAWCEAQSQLVQFTGPCVVHRVELMQLGGDWGEAIDAARAAAQDLKGARGDFQAAGDACYQEAEIHRLRGEHAAAETAYRGASERGRDAQPGLALLRLAQGRVADAVGSIRAALAPRTEPLRRVRYLPASVEILLAAGEIDEARAAARELADTAAAFNTDILTAMASHAAAAVAAAEGRPEAAIDPLRRALRVWQDTGAPYIVARLRVLLARACRDCGDADAATLELDHARVAFADLGAAPDIAALDAAGPPVAAARQHGLSRRELEVLRLVATGKTNKAIARELHLSEKTVDRHVSNIFSKVNVGSRAAATAYAYQQRLV